MISVAHRFHGYGSLRYVYRHGKTVRTPLSSLKYVENSRRNSYRLAVVVSKKVSKSAVVRNRIRRRMYESVRRSAPGFTIAYDLVLTVYSEALATMPATEVDQLVRDQLRQAGLIDRP